jgi:hypothetical protein
MNKLLLIGQLDQLQPVVLADQLSRRLRSSVRRVRTWRAGTRGDGEAVASSQRCLNRSPQLFRKRTGLTQHMCKQRVQSLVAATIFIVAAAILIALELA